jgi:hypothetical protein
MAHLEEQRQISIGKSAELVIQGLKKIKSDFEGKFDSLNYDIQSKVASLKNGEDGKDGLVGKDGPAGRDGLPGRDGKDGKDGQDGQDGQDGVSVVDARIDFDGSLVITLSTGREMNVGEVVAPDLAEKIKLVTSGGGTSQQVLDTLVDLQDQINVLTGIDGTLGTMAQQDANAVAITGGTINGATVGATTPAAGTFTTLTATGQTSLGGAAGAETVRVLTGTNTGKFTQLSSDVATNTQLVGGVGGTGLVVFSSGTNSTRLRTNGAAGNDQLLVAHTASAVNFLQATGAATGSGPVFSAQGSDTNIDLNLNSKGTGAVNLNTGNGNALRVADSGGTVVAGLAVFGGTSAQNTVYVTPYGSAGTANTVLASKGAGAVIFATNTNNSSTGAEQARVSHTASAVNFVQVTGAATGGSPTISSQGSDASPDLTYNAKGAGRHFFQSGGSSTFQINAGTGQVNRLRVQSSPANFGPILDAVGSDTNIPLVLQPKGTGALQAQQTDSTATGGNARGVNAVDWQTSRGAAGQVASSAYSTIAGGYGHTSSGFASVVAGGYGNTASSTNSGVFTGGSNTASGYISAVVSGQSNTSAGYYNFIGAGFTNSGTSGSAVTTQSGTMNATTAVTLSGSNANIKVGQYITGTSIAAETYVAAISGTSLTLSKVASGSSTSTLSFFTPHGVVVGGGNNQATGSYSFIGGGGDAGTAANRNVASGDWSVVVGGQRNTASGSGSIVVGGGTGGANTASGPYSTILGGQFHVSSGFGSIVTGVSSNTANSGYSSVVGSSRGTTRGILGNTVTPATSEPFSYNNGGVQTALLVVARQTTDATPTVLCSDASAASTVNQVILPNNSAYYFRGTVIANVTGGGNTKSWTIEGAIKRGANAASTTLVGVTVMSPFGDVGAATWTIAAAADTTNGGLQITFTGQAATTIRVVAKLETTEVTF